MQSAGTRVTSGSFASCSGSKPMRIELPSLPLRRLGFLTHACSMRVQRMAAHVVCAMRPTASSARQPSSSRDGPGDAQSSTAKGAKVVPLPKPSTTVYKEGEFVQVGRVSGAFGVRGEVRVEISTDNPRARFGKKGNWLFLRAPQAEGLLARMQGSTEPPMLQVTTVSAKVQMLQRGEEAWLVKVSELVDRSQAEQLLDYTIYIQLADRETLRDPDEFWVQDLVGCTLVLKATQKPVGRVLDLISGTGTHDTLVVELAMSRADILASQQRRVMVPFVKAIVPVVDKARRLVVVDPPEGLLDIATPVPLKRKLTPEQQAQLLERLKQGQPVVPLQEAEVGPAAAGAVQKPVAAGAGAQGVGAAKSTAKGAANRAAAPAARRRTAMEEEDEVEEDEDADAEEEVKVNKSHARVRSQPQGKPGSGQASEQGGSENWKLRRRMGASLTAAQRKPGLRGARAARSSQAADEGEDSE